MLTSILKYFSSNHCYCKIHALYTR